jgi:cyclohexa-1,5-dienecarbonyl-CoA hydratase
MATHTRAKLSRVSVKRHASLARILLSHPPMNVIDVPLMEELNQELARVESDDGVSVVVFSGIGKSFSAGADVAAHTPDKAEEMLRKFHAVIRAVIASRKITIAAVHGSCLGGGAELAMVCDMVYTADSATWGFPEIKLGCFPPVASTALAALVGQKQAADLILTGRTIDGREAAAIGLANRAVSREELDARVRESTDHLTKLSPAALAVAKKAIYAWDSVHFDKGLARAETIYLEELLKTRDAREGIEAFLQKREPQWKGR